MNNYEYIITSLPTLTPEWRFSEGKGFDDLIAEIRENCSAKDNALIDTLLKGFDENALDSAFYDEALKSKDRFIREYFAYDLAMRNAKVRYLNKSLGRAAGQDIFADEPEGSDEGGRIAAVLDGTDILARERGLDDLMWEKVDEITVFDYFDIRAILSFIAKLHIVNRWYVLDEKTGREMFRKLVNEVRGTFKGVKYEG